MRQRVLSLSASGESGEGNFHPKQESGGEGDMQGRYPIGEIRSRVNGQSVVA